MLENLAQVDITNLFKDMWKKTCLLHTQSKLRELYGTMNE